MVKLEPIKSIIRSRSSSLSSSSDDSDYDDARSTSSFDSGLSLIETSTINSLKSYQKRQIPTSVHIISQGTLIRDINNNHWIVHQCLKVSHHNERFIYLCSQVKRSLKINDIKISEQNIIKIKISPLMYLTEKLKQSRQSVIDKAYTENDKLDYIFYGAMIGNTNKEIQLIILNNQKQIFQNKSLCSSINDPNCAKMIHGIIEFLKDDDTYDENKINKYSIEILFAEDQKSFNRINNPSELIQQIIKKEIDKLKNLRKTNTKFTGDSHQYILTQKSSNSSYEIQETSSTEQDYSSIESSPTKYLLKLELVPSSTSNCYTIDDEISFYSRFATHENLKSYIKRHNLMYIAIPEYISHGIYKHLNSTYKFLIMEQYRENLRSLIYSYDQSLPEHNALNLFLQMLYVIQFLHEKNYVHYIIKPKYLMFANKQPYFIYLTQFRTVKNIQESNEVPKETIQLKKKVKHSHRTQLTSIHNKNASIVPDIQSPMIEDDNFLINPSIYYHPLSIYASLDMHLNNKQTYRGDLEMLGYNLIVWSGGQLPWEKKKSTNIQTKTHDYTIANEKKLAKSNVNEFVKKCFFMKLISPVTLRAICDYMSTVYQLNIDDIPNFDQLRAPIKEIVKALGFKANACLRLSNSKSKTVNVSNNQNRNSSNNTQIIKTNGNINKHVDVNDIASPAKELEVEQDDLEDEVDEDEENQSCSEESSSCEEEEEEDDDDDDHNSSTNDHEDDTQMEQQAPTVSDQTLSTKCKRCGGDHSLEDQQSQTSSDKQSSNNNNNLNTLTYQQKRQRSIAKRLQLRRKNKN